MLSNGPEFQATISYRAFYMTNDDCHVQVKRLSDGKEIVRTFEWFFPRRRAERWARSASCLRRAFAAQDAWDAKANQRFTVEA